MIQPPSAAAPSQPRLAEVAVPLAVFALGNILGTILGGQMADRLPNRLLTFAGAMFGSGVVALALFGWTAGGLAGTVALGFAYVFVNAIAPLLRKARQSAGTPALSQRLRSWHQALGM